MTNGLLKMADMCALYQVTRFTVFRWYKAGVLPPPIRIKRTLRWNRADVEAALRSIAMDTPPVAL